MITFEEFERIDLELRQARPKPFLLIPPDHPASESELLGLELALKMSLPENYKKFLAHYGGDNFGFANIFSVDPGGEWYLLHRQSEAVNYLPAHSLAFSDDFAGGYYCFDVVNGRAQEAVSYWNRDGGMQAAKLSNVFEFVEKYAYRPS